MPYIARGEKYVYGWSKVGKAGRVAIPPEAMKDYRFIDGQKVILMSGSRRSGGFALTTRRLLRASPLSFVLTRVPGLESFKMPEGRPVRIGEGAFSWAMIEPGGCITLSREALSEYDIMAGDSLLVVKGSSLAIGFAQKGPLVEEAVQHRELEVFE